MNKEQAEAVCEFNDHLAVACGIAEKMTKICGRTDKRFLKLINRLHTDLECAMLGDEQWYFLRECLSEEPIVFLIVSAKKLVADIYGYFAGCKGARGPSLCELSRDLLKHLSLAGCAVEQIKNERTQP